MKKLLNKLCIISLLLVVIFVSFGAIQNINKPRVAGAIANSQLPNEAITSLSAEDRLLRDTMDRYLGASSETHMYTEQFAGIWYDSDGKLNVGVTNNERAASRSKEVLYHTHQFSYNFLNELHGELVALMDIYSISSVGITPQYNQVRVELSSEEDITKIIAQLVKLSFNEEVIKAINFVVEIQEVVFTSRSIHGGEMITDNDGYSGTLAAKAVCNRTGRRGVITNAHVAPANTAVYHGGISGERIGTRAQWQESGIVDAAFIPYDNPDEWEHTSSASYWENIISNITVIPTTYQVAVQSDIVVGLPIAQFGKKTGRTDGKIEEINVTRNVEGTRFTDQIRHSARTDFGDSGGPVFITSNNRYTLAGIHFANIEGTTTSYANKITNVIGALDVTIEAPRGNNPNEWIRPTWSSNSNIHGTITASDSTDDRQPYGAFDGWIGDVGHSGFPAAQWTQTSSTIGWIQLTLNYDIIVHSIEFYNRWSGGTNWTRDSYFTAPGRCDTVIGTPFEGKRQNGGRTEIKVNNIQTNVIRLNIGNSWGSMIGANEIIIHASVVPPTQPIDDTWSQPAFTSNSNNAGTITASGQYVNEAPWKAFNGTLLGTYGGNGDEWSVNSTAGFIQLKLNSYILVQGIEFYNGCSAGSHRTKDARFIGKNGAPLGNPFTAPNQNHGYVYVPVSGGVLTNVIQLSISSSYGNYVGAAGIVIHATVPTTQPTDNYWSQPIWTTNSNTYGALTASGEYSNEYRWRAYNGNIFGGAGGDGDVWSVKAKSGWLQLTLNTQIRIYAIEIWGDCSSASNRTKDFYFSGSGGTNDMLGASQTFANKDLEYRYIPVDLANGKMTNVIRLNITSSYGSYVGASFIKIHAAM